MVKPNGLQIKYKMFNNIHDFQLLLKSSRMLGLEMFHLKKKKFWPKPQEESPHTRIRLQNSVTAWSYHDEWTTRINLAKTHIPEQVSPPPQTKHQPLVPISLLTSVTRDTHTPTQSFEINSRRTSAHAPAFWLSSDCKQIKGQKINN